MTGRRFETGLDRLLGQSPPPQVPAHLAGQIVTETSALPQHPPRETIIAVLPQPSGRKLGEHAVGQRWAGIGAFAAAACLIALLLPWAAQKPMEPAAPPAREQSVAALPAPMPQAQMAEAPASVASPHDGSKVRPKRATKRPVPEEAEIADATSPPAAVPLLLAEPPAVEKPQVADMAGPKTPIQGPPAPIDLTPANGRTKAGLGVVGGSGGPTAGMPRSR